jgi:AraC-binding-like domain
METIVRQRDDSDEPRLDFETWRALFGSTCGRYTLERADPNAFAGWVRPLSVLGFSAVDVACNENRIDRTQRDIRLDGMDLYGAVFQVAGRSTVSHNNQTVQLAKAMSYSSIKPGPFHTSQITRARIGSAFNFRAGR